MTHSQRFGKFGAGLEFSHLPRNVVEKAKLHILDSIAVSYAFVKSPLARGLVAMARRGKPAQQASIIGFSGRTSAREAAFVNGAIGHGNDFDDVHVGSITHPTVVVLPAALALGQLHNRTGQDVITAYVFGVETCIRLGIAGGAAMARRGIPPMTICGTLGAAAAAAKILNLDKDEIASAIGVSGSFASGSHQWTIDGGNSKLTTPGWAARSGVIAAMMAARGFDGSKTAIEGRRGLMVAMAGPEAYDKDEPSMDLGRRWETLNLALKQYGSCQGTQPYIRAAMELIAIHQFDTDAIERIEIKVGEHVGRSLSEPIDAKRSPPDGYAAKFSIPFCVALALKFGDVKLSYFGEQWSIAKSAAPIAKKVVHTIDPLFDEGVASRGFVSIMLNDGRVLTCETGAQLDALNIDDVKRKFADCADGIVSPDRQNKIAEMTMRLDKTSNIGMLMELVAPASP